MLYFAADTIIYRLKLIMTNDIMCKASDEIVTQATIKTGVMYKLWN